MNRVYACIDLKSFYASVECRERGLDPLSTNLVVADTSRTEKTVCLAITPSLKQYGLSGRARLFEVIKKVNDINYNRRRNNNYKSFTGKSYDDNELKNNKNLELSYIAAPPQMKKYMKYSTDIYKIYLKYIAPEDIFPYSIDEVFCDITSYLNTYKLTPKELISKIIKDVYNTTGITATSGIGTNMFLAKVAMDIVAKHTDADEYGVRIAELDEIGYRKLLWEHKPLTDFWRMGPGITKKLEKYSMYNMGDIARMSLINEDLLYKLFGVNAELIIDHAWGYEPTTIREVKEYKPKRNSISSGQVLHCPYKYDKTKLIIKEMIDNISLDLVSKHKITDTLVLTINYDYEMNMDYNGARTFDHYGRCVPKSAHGSIKLPYKTSSVVVLMRKILELYDKIINKNLYVRKITISACDLTCDDNLSNQVCSLQLDLFGDNSLENNENEVDKKNQEDELKLEKTILEIKNKYGKNSIVKVMNLEDGATGIDRNNQIGGHRG